MNSQIKYAKDLIKHDKIKRISDRFWEVSNHDVFLQVKSGRKFFNCDCINSTKFTAQQICSHIIAVILFEGFGDYYKKLDELINYYNMEKQLTKDKEMETKMFMILNDLENLKRLKID